MTFIAAEQAKDSVLRGVNPGDSVTVDMYGDGLEINEHGSTRSAGPDWRVVAEDGAVVVQFNG